MMLLWLLHYLVCVGSASTVQVVTVGKDGQLAYSPETFNAAVGSQVEFQFYGPQHSVVQASFDQPCLAFENGTGFFAGLKTEGTGPNPSTFTLTINDTAPVWFYCAFPSHCQAGMVGVINPSSNESESLEIFKSMAANAMNSTAPAQQQGGVFGPLKAATNASAGNPASASSTASVKPSPTSTGDASRRGGEIALIGSLAIVAALMMM